MLRPSPVFPCAALAVSLAIATAHAQEAAPPQSAPANSATSVTLEAYDRQAEALLQRAADLMKNAPSFSARVQTISNVSASGTRPARQQRYVTTYRLQKPNRVSSEGSLEKHGADGKWTATPTFKSVSDGKKGAEFRLTDKTYRVLNVTPKALTEDYGLNAFNFPDFFDPTKAYAQQVRDAKASGMLVSLTLAPDAVWGGVPCFVVEEKKRLTKDANASSAQVTTKAYIGKKDGILRGYHVEAVAGGSRLTTLDTIITNVVVGAKLPASTFALNVTGYKKYVETRGLPLLAAGTVAPNFTVYDKGGKPVKLSDYRGKVVVLDFWATWCGPCIKSLPHTTEVARKTADKGVVVLALNVWDKKHAFNQWLPEHPEFSALTFAIDTKTQGQDVATKLYRVSGIPTQYVIDRSGRIVTAFVGFGGPTEDLEKAIAKADAGATGTQK